MPMLTARSQQCHLLTIVTNTIAACETRLAAPTRLPALARPPVNDSVMLSVCCHPINTPEWQVFVPQLSRGQLTLGVQLSRDVRCTCKMRNRSRGWSERRRRPSRPITGHSFAQKGAQMATLLATTCTH